MKRLNPNTGLPFKKGDFREDGYRFKEYKLKLKKNGFFEEHWYNQNSFDNHEEYKTNYILTLVGRSNALFSAARNRALKHNLEFDLSISRIQSALEKGICELTGLKFDLNRCEETFKNPYSPSIDRIDSNLGYINSNIRVVLTAVNIALNEFNDTTMLPVLKAMVKAIEKNAKQNTTTPVPTRPDREGEDHSLDGFVLATGPGEDDNDAHHHCGADARQDADHRAQASSGDSVGAGNQEVVALMYPPGFKDPWDDEPEIVRLEFGRRYLFDKP